MTITGHMQGGFSSRSKDWQGGLGWPMKLTCPHPEASSGYTFDCFSIELKSAMHSLFAESRALQVEFPSRRRTEDDPWGDNVFAWIAASQSRKPARPEWFNTWRWCAEMMPNRPALYFGTLDYGIFLNPGLAILVFESVADAIAAKLHEPSAFLGVCE
ncbi:MAG: hypothetical protein ACRYHQ_25965 [Janthinobacterium lividum]